VITQTELEMLHAADEARAEVIRVDDFDAREYPKLRR
jgi:hypothetical protein